MLQGSLSAQIIFNNPSFEGPKANNSAPPQWQICSGTPDVLPPNMGGPVVPPSDGNTCLGMVNALPGIEESIGQLLPDTLYANVCYSFDIDLRYVPTYLAPGCNPGMLRLWLGDSICKKQQLAYQSPVITHGVWRTYSVSFISNQNYTHAAFDLIHNGSTPENVCMAADNIRNESVGISNSNILGNDTLLCPGDSILLDATFPNSTYRWQDNSTAATYNVKQAGLYHVEITTAGSCIARDTIRIDYFDDLFIGNDTLICGNDSLLLSSNITGPGISYQWQDNSTNASLFAKDAGWYSLTTTLNSCIQTDSLLLSKTADPMLDLGNDTAFCIGQSFLLDATTSTATSYLWSDNSTSSQLSVSSSGIYSVTVSIGACDYVDSIDIIFNNLNPFDLGADTEICLGDSIILRAPQGAGFSYQWNNSSTNDTLAVKQAGKYWVDVSIGNCIETDTINIDVSAFNESLSNLGSDSILCNGATMLLDATVPAATSYLWSDNSTNPTLSISVAGDYLVTISDGTCSFVDSIRVSAQSLPSFSFGPDTILCPLEVLSLAPPQNTNYSYVWQDNTTASNFEVSSAGTYWVTVFEGECFESDTIVVSYNNFDPSELELGNDTSICPQDSLLLDASVSWGDSYLWEDNSTSPQRFVKVDQQYKVTVTSANCQVIDSIEIDHLNFEFFSLGPDTVLCINDSLILRSPNLPNYTYRWQDGSSGTIFIVKNPGKYWLTATLGSCEYTDTIEVNYNSLIAPRPNLGPDTNLCEGVQLTLDATTPNGLSFRWHDGSTAATFIASGLKDSIYAVEVFNGICSGRDSILVGGIEQSRIVSGTTILCKGKELTLSISPSVGLHTWQDGSQGDIYTVLDSGKFTVNSNVEHCVFRDSVSIELQDCECEPLVPNVLTPNGDGINDELLITQENCDYDLFEMRVFNRYGKEVFRSNVPNQGWNGRHQEKKASEGQYFYILEYSTLGGEKEVVKGSFSLLY